MTKTTRTERDVRRFQPLLRRGPLKCLSWCPVCGRFEFCLIVPYEWKVQCTECQAVVPRRPSLRSAS